MKGKIRIGCLLLVLMFCGCGTDATGSRQTATVQQGAEKALSSEAGEYSSKQNTELQETDMKLENSKESVEIATEADGINTENTTDVQDTATTDESEDRTMTLAIDGAEVTVEWEDNESVEALRELVQEKPLSVSMSMYGGFEQVGFLGTRLPRDDEQTTTSAGDIVLYSGNQIVIFYGSNTWAYTPLGKIAGLSQDDLRGLLGNGDVTITLTYSSPQGS